MNDSTTGHNGTERRLYQRIDEDIYLEYRVLTDAEYQEAIDDFSQQPEGYFNPINQLQAIAMHSRQTLELIRLKDPLIAEYLVAQDEKIQLLAHAVAQDRVGIPVVPNEYVNISAGGLSFHADTAYPAGSPIEITIVIIPHYLHFYALGQIVYCHETTGTAPEARYRIGVEFKHVHEADREALLKHVTEYQRRDTD